MIEPHTIQLIKNELARAKAKWPEWPEDAVHAAAVVAEESGELVQAALQFQYEGASRKYMFEEAIQTAAMAIRFIEGFVDYAVADLAETCCQLYEVNRGLEKTRKIKSDLIRGRVEAGVIDRRKFKRFTPDAFFSNYDPAHK